MTPREYLAGLEFHGIKLGLENIRRLTEAAGNPERAVPVVHVAGTNGKGSVLAFLDAILRAAGYRTGRYTSPHLIDVNERFLFDGAPIADDELDAHLAFFQTIARDWDHSPTYFEVVTATAFRAFAAHQVDLALIEVGMGGRFDATNIVQPTATAITNIDLEHTRYLGDTLGKIAFEKAGILKPGVPLVCGEQKSEPLGVILGRAEEEHGPVRLLGRDFAFTAAPSSQHRLAFHYESPTLVLGPVDLGLPGRYQAPNAALAVALAETLQPSFAKITPDAIGTGLHRAHWPCRLERVVGTPPVLLDVAHNAAGIARLAEEFERAVVILAIAADKDAAAMIAALAPIAAPLILTQFEGPRAMSLDALCAAAGTTPYCRFKTLDAALTEGLSRAQNDCPLLVAGSFHTAGQARTLLARTLDLGLLRF